MKKSLLLTLIAAAALSTSLLAGGSSIARADNAFAPNAAATPATAASDTAAPNEHKGIRKMLKELNLTPTEMSNIKALVKSQRDQIAALKNNTTLTDKQRKQQMRQIRQSTMAQIRADLTPAQQQTFDADVAQAKADRKANRLANK